MELHPDKNNPNVLRLLMSGIMDGQEARENKFNQITLGSGTQHPTLAYYCSRGNLEQVKYLATETNVNKEDDWGRPLSEAVQHGHLKIATHLLTLGASVDRPDHYGVYPIHRAAEFGDPDIFELLLKNGANPNRSTTEATSEVKSNPGLIFINKGRQPIHYAAKHGNYLIVKKLITLASVVVVILLINIDRLVIIDDYIKATILFVLAGILSIYEYKRDEKLD